MLLLECIDFNVIIAMQEKKNNSITERTRARYTLEGNKQMA